MNKIMKMIKNLECYRFASFLYGQYVQMKSESYTPEAFAFFGEGAIVDHGVRITDPARVTIKEHSVIHRGAFISSSGGLYIGRYSGIGYNCCIFTIDHKIFKVRSIPFDREAFLKPVIVEDFVIMGANVSITPGVRIGEGAVIAMGSVLTRDVPPLAIVMGNPAEPVAYRDKELFGKLKEDKSFQPQVVGEYINSIPLKYRKQCTDFLAQIGLENHLQKKTETAPND